MKILFYFCAVIALALGNEESQEGFRTNKHPHELTPETLSLLSQHVDSKSSSSSGDSSLPFWSSYPDAASFDAKIRTRLGTSKVLSEKPEIRRKIIEIAEGKLNNCKGKVEDMERVCLGRSTGQIMQLVAAVENMARFNS